MKRIYIAGPMSGLRDYNYAAFHACAKFLRGEGFAVENPAENGEPACGSWNGYLKTALRQMLSCDLVLLLPGWEKSKGANLEKETAERVGIETKQLAGFVAGHIWGSHIMDRCQPAEPSPETVPQYFEPLETQTFGPKILSVDEWTTMMRETFDAALKPTNPKDAVGSDKLPLHLWPETASALGCLGLLDGMLKYGRSNFRAIGVRASIYVDAAKRHINAWFEGEDADPDSGLPHMAHALACIAIIVDAEAAGKLTDDRMYPGGYRASIQALTPHVQRLKQLHAEKSPKHYMRGVA